MSYKSVSLHHKPGNILVFALVWGLPLSVVYSLLRYGDIRLAGLALFVLVTVVAVWPAAFLTDMAFPSAVSESGVRGYTFFSLPKSVAWDRIRGVKALNLWPCLPYLAVLDGDGFSKRVILPMYSTNQKAFYDRVVELQGEEHPLAVGLREHGFAA